MRIILLLFFCITVGIAQDNVSDRFEYVDMVLLPADFGSKSIFRLDNKNNLIVMDDDWVVKDSVMLLTIWESGIEKTVPINQKDFPRKGAIMDIAKYDRNLYLLELQHIYHFIENGDIYQLKEIIDVPDLHFNLEVSDKALIAYTCIPVSDRSIDKSTRIFIYDLLKRKGESYYLRNPNGLRYTLVRPRHVLEYFDGNLLLSDITEYKITFYNDAFEPQDSIVRKPDEWVSPEKQSTSKEESLADTFNKMKGRSLIQSVDYIDSHRIFVVWTIPSEERLYEKRYDIWKKQMGQWKLEYASMEYEEPDSSANFDPLKFDLRRHHIEGEYFLLYSFFPFEYNHELLNTPNEELYRRKSDYLFGNDPRYSVIIWRFK